MTYLIEEFHSPGNRLKARDKTGLLNASLVLGFNKVCIRKPQD